MDVDIIRREIAEVLSALADAKRPGLSEGGIIRQVDRAIDAGVRILGEVPRLNEDESVMITCWNCGTTPNINCCEYGRAR